MVEVMLSILWYIRPTNCQRFTVTDILHSDHQPIMFSILDPVRTRTALDPVAKLTDWELFQSLASALISPNIQTHYSDEADKAAHGFAASAYRLSTRKTMILTGNTKYLV
jgi:hypothetical protein